MKFLKGCYRFIMQAAYCSDTYIPTMWLLEEGEGREHVGISNGRIPQAQQAAAHRAARRATSSRLAPGGIHVANKRRRRRKSSMASLSGFQQRNPDPSSTRGRRKVLQCSGSSSAHAALRVLHHQLRTWPFHVPK